MGGDESDDMDPIALIVKAAQQEKDRLRAPLEAMKSPQVNDIVKSDDDHDDDDDGDESDDMDPIALIVKAAQQEKDRLRAPPEAMKSPLVNDIVKSDDDHDHDDDESDDMDPVALIVKAAQQEKEKQNEKARKIATPNEAAQQELVKLA